MSSSGRRRIEEPAEPIVDEAPVEDGKTPKDKDAKKRKNSRRAAFPTPGFKSFGTLLNLLTLPLASYLATTNLTLNIIVLGILSILGVGIALYSNALRPLATNVQTRKILTAVSLAYGFLLLVVLLLAVLLF